MLKFSRKIKNFFSELQISDISLIIFMAIFIAQSIFTLFFKTKVSDLDNSIDVVFRTSIASIFGYFLSANFAKNINNDSNQSENKSEDDFTNTNQSQLKIGFLPSEEDKTLKQDFKINNKLSNEIVLDETALYESQNIIEEQSSGQKSIVIKNPIKQQVIITTTIGIILLIALIIFRNFVEMENAPAATISQVRDIISSCIGFLLGIPSNAEIDS